MRLSGLAICLALLQVLPVSGQAADRSNLTIWGDILKYGTDTEILSAITSMKEAKERSLLPELAVLLSKSRNEQVRVAILSTLELLADAAGREPALAILATRTEASTTLLRAVMSYLAGLKAAEATEDLLALAVEPEALVAAAAVTTLGRIGAVSAAERLLELYDLEDTPEAVRTQIILALGELKATGGIELLTRIAADREEERVTRMYAAASLGKIGDKSAVETLTALLSEDDAMLRAYAASALGRLRAPGVGETLVQVLRDSSWQVRLEAARAIADGAAEGSVTDELVGMLLYRAKRDEVAQVRRETIRALGGIGRADGMALLREIYIDPLQPLDLRGAALTELIRVDLAGSLSSIENVVAQEWSARTQKALELTSLQLSEVESPAIAGLLGRFLDSANIAVKIAGIRGVARNRLHTYADALRRAALQANVSLKREALSALEKLGLSAALPAAVP